MTFKRHVGLLLGFWRTHDAGFLEVSHVGWAVRCDDLIAEAILLCESDGTPEEVEEEIDCMSAVLCRCRTITITITISRNEAAR